MRKFRSRKQGYRWKIIVHSEEEEEHKSVDNVSEAKDDVGKDGSQSDNNDSEEEEEHKSLDNVSEAKDPDDYFDNGEGNKTCL